MKGILFKEELFKAILEGRKTQTRRVIKLNYELYEWRFTDLFDKAIFTSDLNTSCQNHAPGPYREYIAPRYKVGETVYMKEPYSVLPKPINATVYKFDLGDSDIVATPCGDTHYIKWKNKLFMPEKYARHFIKITGVRVERAQDISEQDAIAEGVEVIRKAEYMKAARYKDYGGGADGWLNPINSFDSLWIKINGKKSWDDNPFVFVYEFEIAGG